MGNKILENWARCNWQVWVSSKTGEWFWECCQYFWIVWKNLNHSDNLVHCRCLTSPSKGSNHYFELIYEISGGLRFAYQTGCWFDEGNGKNYGPEDQILICTDVVDFDSLLSLQVFKKNWKRDHYDDNR